MHWTRRRLGRRVACLTTLCVGAGVAGPSCPQVSCEEYVVPARWTGRVAILVTGFIRTAVENIPTLRAIKARNAPATAVEVYYHVWYNASAPCDVAAVAKLRAFGDGVSFEPTACAWSWGNGGFPNHWHAVYNAFRALHAVFGKDPRTDYGLIMHTGTDVAYANEGAFFFNFSALWVRFSGSDEKNFAVLGYANGFDRAMFGTPSLVRAYSMYGPNNEGCDSRFDSFPFQRFRRYGVTTESSRCAARLHSTATGVFRGTLLRPTAALGCREHSTTRRRLAIAPPKHFLAAGRSSCAMHQFDTLDDDGVVRSRNHSLLRPLAWGSHHGAVSVVHR